MSLLYKRKQNRRKKQKRSQPDAILSRYAVYFGDRNLIQYDLHGLLKSEVLNHWLQAFNYAQNKQAEYILFVHGYRRGTVLRQEVHKLLRERTNFKWEVTSRGGATLVYLSTLYSDLFIYT